jgi:hypothetical protein
MMKSMIFFGLFVALAVAVPMTDISDTDSLQDDMVVDVQQQWGLKKIKKTVVKPILGWFKRPVHKHVPADKDTKAYGGNGGRVVDAKCAPGAWIVSWGLRTGNLVDSIQGKCSDGKLLTKCGGNGGKSKGFVADSDSRVAIRTGRLVDKFEGQGGNGGNGAVMECGKGYRARGYKFRCGSLVDQVQLHCRRSDLLDAEKKKVDAAKALAAKAAQALKDAAAKAAKMAAAAKAAAAKLAKDLKDKRAAEEKKRLDAEKKRVAAAKALAAAAAKALKDAAAKAAKIAAAAKAAAAKLVKDLKDKRAAAEKKRKDEEAKLKALEEQRLKDAEELKKAMEEEGEGSEEEEEKVEEEQEAIVEEAAKTGASIEEKEDSAIGCDNCVQETYMACMFNGCSIRSAGDECRKKCGKA